jgi:Co/Zn/Cd efflux system component
MLVTAGTKRACCELNESMTHSHHKQHDHDRSGHAPRRGSHVHAPASFGTAFAIGVTLNTAFVIVEGIFGYAGNSMALVADAGHNLSDVLGLVVAWVAVILSKRTPSPALPTACVAHQSWRHCSTRCFCWSPLVR